MKPISQETAESWMKAVALWLLLSGALLILGAPVTLLFAIFAPEQLFAESLPHAMLIAFGIFMAVLNAGFGILLWMWGVGFWQQRPWARILAIVFSWIQLVIIALFAVAIFIIMVITAFFSQAAFLLMSILMLFMLLALGLSILQLWFFQFNKTVESLFAEANLSFAITKKNVHSVVHAWGIIEFFSAVSIGIVGAGILIAGINFPALLELLQEEIVFPFSPVWIMMVGVVLLIWGALYSFIGRGLWNIEPWARTLAVFLGWATLFLLPLNLIIAAFFGNSYALVSTVLQVILYQGFVIWLLQYNPYVRWVFWEQRKKEA